MVNRAGSRLSQKVVFQHLDRTQNICAYFLCLRGNFDEKTQPKQAIENHNKNTTLERSVVLLGAYIDFTSPSSSKMVINI